MISENDFFEIESQLEGALEEFRVACEDMGFSFENRAKDILERLTEDDD